MSLKLEWDKLFFEPTETDDWKLHQSSYYNIEFDVLENYKGQLKTSYKIAIVIRCERKIFYSDTFIN